jgi:Ni/Co efflux regulator RcnB
VRRISAGRYFGRRQVDLCERYFHRRCALYSEGFRGRWRHPWRVGYVLPAYVTYWPVPEDFYYDLPECPYGYDYCQVEGGDIVLISLVTGVVVDAILFY